MDTQHATIYERLNKQHSVVRHNTSMGRQQQPHRWNNGREAQ